MIYTAKELHHKLTHLTLVGQEDGQLQFIGTDKQWNSEDEYKARTGRDDFDSGMENYLESVR